VQKEFLGPAAWRAGYKEKRAGAAAPVRGCAGRVRAACTACKDAATGCGCAAPSHADAYAHPAPARGSAAALIKDGRYANVVVIRDGFQKELALRAASAYVRSAEVFPTVDVGAQPDRIDLYIGDSAAGTGMAYGIFLLDGRPCIQPSGFRRAALDDGTYQSILALASGALTAADAGAEGRTPLSDTALIYTVDTANFYPQEPDFQGAEGYLQNAVTLIRSAQELSAFTQKSVRSGGGKEFAQAFSGYDDAFFQENVLVAAIRQERTLFWRPVLLNMVLDRENTLYLRFLYRNSYMMPSYGDAYLFAIRLSKEGLSSETLEKLSVAQVSVNEGGNKYPTAESAISAAVIQKFSEDLSGGELSEGDVPNVLPSDQAPIETHVTLNVEDDGSGLVFAYVAADLIWVDAMSSGGSTSGAGRPAVVLLEYHKDGYSMLGVQIPASGRDSDIGAFIRENFPKDLQKQALALYEPDQVSGRLRDLSKRTVEWGALHDLHWAAQTPDEGK